MSDAFEVKFNTIYEREVANSKQKKPRLRADKWVPKGRNGKQSRKQANILTYRKMSDISCRKSYRALFSQ